MKKIAALAALAVLLAGADAFAGSKKPAKPAPKATASAAISRTAACWARFNALCGAMQACAKNAEDMGAKCEAIDPGCDKLSGSAPVTQAKVDECVAGLKKLSCHERVDPADLLDLESRVPACKAIALAEAEAEKRDAGERRTATASR